MTQKSQQFEILNERMKDTCKFQNPFDKTFTKNQLSLLRCLDAIKYFISNFSTFFFIYFHCYYFYYNFYCYYCYYYHFFTLLSELLYYVKLLLLYYHHNYHYYSQVEILSRFLIGILIGSFQDPYNRSLNILTRILLSFLSNLIRFLAGSYQDF